MIPEDVLNIGRERIEISNAYLRRQAEQALKAAKLLEAQRIANGAKWVENGPKTYILK